MVGEDIAANDYITKPADEGGAGFDTQWQVTMPHAFRQAILPNITDETQLADLVGELGRTYNGDSLQQVIYFDSHDSAANGASRINEEADPGHPQSAKALSKLLIASGILMSAPGIPMMLQGQEFAQGQNFSDWHGLDWDLAEKYSGVVTANKHLINLRKNVHGNSAGLRGQGINISHVDDDNKVLAYHRWDKGGPADDIMVVVNFANNHHKEYVLGFPLNGDWHVRFNSTWHGYSPQFKEVNVPDIKVNSGQGTLVLPPRSLLILSQDT
jgi:1,4-alpha-glucan branching enzyme